MTFWGDRSQRLFLWGWNSSQNILYLGAWDVAVGSTFYGGIFNPVIKFKNKPKMIGFFIFTKQAIEIHGTKISGKIIVKWNGQNKYSI